MVTLCNSCEQQESCKTFEIMGESMPITHCKNYIQTRRETVRDKQTNADRIRMMSMEMSNLDLIDVGAVDFGNQNMTLEEAIAIIREIDPISEETNSRIAETLILQAVHDGANVEFPSDGQTACLSSSQQRRNADDSLDFCRP